MTTTIAQIADLVHLAPSGRWVVAQRDGDRFIAPMTAPSQRLTGASSVCGSLAYCQGNAYHYARRADALRKARELFGA